MEVAKKHNILISNSSGDRLHFWSDLHAIKPSFHYPSHHSGQGNPNQDEKDSDVESGRTLSDEYEYDINTDNSSDSGSDEEITDGSEDYEYAYRPVRDVDFTTDSGSESDLGLPYEWS